MAEFSPSDPQKDRDKPLMRGEPSERSEDLRLSAQEAPVTTELPNESDDLSRSAAQAFERLRKTGKKQQSQRLKKDLGRVLGRERLEDKDLDQAQKVIKGEKDPSEVEEKNQELAIALSRVLPGIIAGAAGGARAGEIASEAAQKNADRIALQAAKREAEERERQQEVDEEELKFKRQIALIDAKTASAKELEELRLENKRQLAMISGGRVPKANERQAAIFAKRIEQAQQAFDRVDQAGADTTSLLFAAKRKLPEFAQPEEVKLQRQAERNFVNAVLRRESGAAIAESEFDSAERQYFPRPGDSPAVLEQKRINRQIALQGLLAEAGRAAEEIEIPEPTVPTESEIARQAGPRSPNLGSLGGQVAVASDDPRIDELAQRLNSTYGTPLPQARSIAKRRLGL